MRFFLSGPPPSSPGSGGGSGREGASGDPTSRVSSPGADAKSSDPARLRKATAENRLLDVITPLNVIVGFSCMLADVGHDLSADVRHRYATRVRDAAGVLERMVSTLVQRLDGKALELSEDWMSSGTFPVAPPAKAAAEEQLEPPPASASAPGTETRPRVFIVDADEGNRELLAEYLAGRGYDLITFGSGDEAVEQAERRPPDLVLIDPLMAREDGFHVARMLKASNASGLVPLIFVTALVDDDSRMRALEAGAEQMVKKPVNRLELRARVKGLLVARSHQQELAVQNAQLKSLQRFKDETTAMLVHDLKSPLSAMMMNLDFALDDLPAEASTADIRTALAESRAAGAKLFRMIANLLDIARSDDGRLTPKRAVIDVDALFQHVISEHSAEAQARRVTITSRLTLDGPIDADPDILGRVLANLVENALRYTHADGSIVLAARRLSGSSVEMTVTNDGRPISPEWRAFVFEKYAQVAASQAINRGLGLYFCRVAVEAHGGTIELMNDSTTTTCFRIELPQPPST